MESSELDFLVQTKLIDNQIIINIKRNFLDDEYSHIIYRLYKDGKGYRHYKLDQIQNDYVFLLNEEGVYFVKVSIYQNEKKIERNSVSYEFFLEKTYNELENFLLDEKIGTRLKKGKYYPHTDGVYKDFVVVVNADVSDVQIEDMQKKKMLNSTWLYGACVEDMLFSGQGLVDNVYLDGNTDLKIIKEYGDRLKDGVGCFNYLYKSGENMVITADYFGMGKIYFYQSDITNLFIASNRYHLLLLAMRQLNVDALLDENLVAAHIYIQDATTAQFMAPNLFVKDTQILPLYKLICITQNGEIIFKDTSFVENFKPVSWDEEEYKLTLRKSVAEMRNSVKAIFDSGKFSYYYEDLTGGMDSRITFALINSIEDAKNKIRLRTFGGEKEKRCAYSLANHFGFKYSVAYNKLRDSFKRLNPLNASEYLEFLLSMYIGVDFEPTGLREIPYIFDKSSLRFTGASGEAMTRQYVSGKVFKKIGKSFEKTIEEYILQMSGRTVLGYDNIGVDFKNILLKNFTDSPYSEEKRIYEWPYLNTRTRVHFDLSYKASFFQTEWSPLITKNAYKASQMALTNFECRKYVYDLLYEINPEIAAFEYLDEENNRERLKFSDELICTNETYKNIVIRAVDEEAGMIEKEPVKLLYNPSQDWDDKELNEYIFKRFIIEFKSLMLRSPLLKEKIGVPIYHFLTVYEKSSEHPTHWENTMLMLYKIISSCNEIYNIFEEI